MPDNDIDDKLPPPSGDTQRAQGYVDQLLPLISESKLRVVHTDLSRFDPSSLHDHYSLDLNDYQIEISHSKQPTTGRDSYVILFNNLKNVSQGETQKEILAYLIISEEQFKKLKDVADEQIETLKKIEEEKRFKTAMTDVDTLLGKIAKGEVDLSKSPQPIPAIPTKEEKIKEPPTSSQSTEDTPTPPEQTLEPTPQEPTSQEPIDIAPPAYATPETKLEPEKLPQKTLSPLEAAAAIPLVEETPIAEDPPIPLEPSPPTTPVEEPQPLNPTNTASIEEVQKALHQAYQQAPPAEYPKEYRPSTATVSTEIPTPVDETLNTIPVENNLNASPPQLDQAIDQAFKPADNNLLTHTTNTPEV